MSNIPYISIVGNLIYALVYKRLDLTFAIGMLGMLQSNLGMDYWKAAKKIIRYLPMSQGLQVNLQTH